MPLLPQLKEHLSGAQHCRDVQIMPTGVHHRNFLTGIILHMRGACIRQSGLLFNRQRIEVRANHHGRSRTIVQDCNHAVAGPFGLRILANTFGDCITEPAQFFGEEGGGFLFVMRKFGRGMQALVRHQQ